MISPDSLDKKWIQQCAIEHENADEILIEKMIRALYLLEQLQLNDFDFIFKGGTALILLLSEPKRFSIDIDIIVPETTTDIEEDFNKIIDQTDFIEFEEDKRKSTSSIKKAHYKFYYQPVRSTSQIREYILLDILYENSPYGSHIHSVPIDSTFLKLKGEPTNVQTPTHDAILGDKLTAFAPNTTGIPYGKGKEIEIIKQLYDIGKLMPHIQDIKVVNEVFQNVASVELDYREMKHLGIKDVLEDIYQTALLISSRGQEGNGDYNELHTGIKNIKNYIFSERFHLEKAITPASAAAYISSCLKADVDKIELFSDPSEISDWTIKQPGNTRLNKLKKSNPEAFFNWYHTERIRQT